MTKVRRIEVQAVLDRANAALTEAAAGDSVVTRAELKAKLATMEEGAEKKLVESVFRTLDRMDFSARGEVQTWNLYNLSVTNFTPEREISDRALSKMPHVIQLAARLAQAQLPPPLQHLTGTVSLSGETLTFTTTDGKELALGQSPLRADYLDIDAGTLSGFAGDGPVVLQGTYSKDGARFEVEGFALNTNGKYDTFTFGRVNLENPEKMVVSTSRGDVEITHPETYARLKSMPQLGVILPGAFKREGDRLVYDRAPDELFGLGRFMETGAPKDGTEHGLPGMKWASADMALSTFDSKPLLFPEQYAQRNDHTYRVWVRGMMRLDEAGTAKDFVADYVSLPTDSIWLPDATSPAQMW
jgi:hypothetical protein